ncbi:hypothetical protein LINPERHAP2_LOCUS9278, partial [Linum perenne]
SAIVSQSPPIPIPAKCSDPGPFTLPLIINDIEVERSLVDLGASINVMPMCLYKKLNLGELQPASMHLVFADKT